MDLGKGSKGHATTWGSTCTSKGVTPLKHFSWPQEQGQQTLKSEVLHRFKYPHINCSEEYMGESGRAFGDRLKEHLRAPSPTHPHSHSTGYPVSPECFTIVDREAQGVTRNMMEAMYIHVNDPSLNRNLRKYQLPHIWPIISVQITQLYHLQSHIWATHMYTAQYNWGQVQLQLVSIIPCRGAFPFPIPHSANSTNSLHTPNTPYTQTSLHFLNFLTDLRMWP